MVDMEELSNYAQIIKTGAILLLGTGFAIGGYMLIQAQKRLRQAQGALAMAKKLGMDTRGNYEDIERFQKEEYPVHSQELQALQELPDRYQEGIFEVEKKGNPGDFSTYVTKRTIGLVELIEEAPREYSAKASFVSPKERLVSELHIRTKDNRQGSVDFPHIFSPEEREAILNNTVAYEEKYSCHDEGEFHDLLQGWHYKLEVLDGPKKGLKLKEDITV